MISQRIKPPHPIVDNVTYLKDGTIVNAHFTFAYERMGCKRSYDVGWIAEEGSIFVDEIVVVVIYKVEQYALSIQDHYCCSKNEYV
jgi:hypothetical protein